MERVARDVLSDHGEAESLSTNEKYVFYSIGLGLVGAIGLTSVLLEKFIHFIKHAIAGSFLINKVVTDILQEITVLGMLSFALFLCSQWIPEDLHDYVELVENAHMMLFIWMGLWITLVLFLVFHVELLFLFFAMAEKSPDGDGIKTDRLSRYCCILNYLSSSGPEQFVEYRRYRALFAKNFLRQRSAYSDSDAEPMSSMAHMESFQFDEEHEEAMIQEVYKRFTVTEAKPREAEGVAAEAADSMPLNPVLSSSNLSTASTDDDFHFNEYLLIMSWKQLLHFLNVDWKVWIYIVAALGVLYIWVLVGGLFPGDLLLIIDLSTYLITFTVAFILNRYVYPGRTPNCLRIFHGSRAATVSVTRAQDIEASINADVSPSTPLHESSSNLLYNAPEWKRKWRLIMPLPWELLLLKMFVFIQIGIAAFALVFPELMWERFDVTPISGLILSFEVAVLPIATLGTATRIFPQFLLSASIRFPLEEVLRVMGYIPEDEQPGMTVEESRYYRARRKAEAQCLRSMLKYRESTRSKSQARRWIPFIIRNKKKLNVLLAVLVVLVAVVVIVLGVVNIWTDEEQSIATVTLLVTFLGLYFLVLLPLWQFVAPLRWYSKSAALSKIVPKRQQPSTRGQPRSTRNDTIQLSSFYGIPTNVEAGH